MRVRRTTNHQNDIVADHTFWEGFDGDTRVHKDVICMECQTKPIVGQRWYCNTCLEYNICGLCHSCRTHSSIEPGCKLSLTCLPEETLYIRSSMVSHALVIASLQILKDWQKDQIRKQRSKDPWGFMQTEEAARQHDLGKLGYRRGSEIGRKVLDAPLRVRSRGKLQKPYRIQMGAGLRWVAWQMLAWRWQQEGSKVIMKSITADVILMEEIGEAEEVVVMAVVEEEDDVVQ